MEASLGCMMKGSKKKKSCKHCAEVEGWSHFGVQTHKKAQRTDGREGCCCSSPQLLHPSKLLLSPPLLRSQLSCSSQKSQIVLPWATLTEPRGKGSTQLCTCANVHRRACGRYTHSNAHARLFKLTSPAWHRCALFLPTHALTTHTYTHMHTHTDTLTDCLHAVTVIKTH